MYELFFDDEERQKMPRLFFEEREKERKNEERLY